MTYKGQKSIPNEWKNLHNDSQKCKNKYTELQNIPKIIN